jgi:hypothetical protein
MNEQQQLDGHCSRTPLTLTRKRTPPIDTAWRNYYFESGVNVARTSSRAITTIPTADRSGDDYQHVEIDGSSAAREGLGRHINNAAFDDDGANKKRPPDRAPRLSKASRNFLFVVIPRPNKT